MNAFESLRRIGEATSCLVDTLCMDYNQRVKAKQTAFYLASQFNRVKSPRFLGF